MARSRGPHTLQEDIPGCTNGSKVREGCQSIFQKKSSTSGINLQMFGCIQHFIVLIICTGLPGKLARLTEDKHAALEKL